VGWGGGESEDKKKPNVYAVQYSYQKTAAMKTGFDGTTV